MDYDKLYCTPEEIVSHIGLALFIIKEKIVKIDNPFVSEVHYDDKTYEFKFKSKVDNSIKNYKEFEYDVIKSVYFSIYNNIQKNSLNINETIA